MASTPGGGMRTSRFAGQAGWRIDMLSSCTYHRADERPLGSSRRDPVTVTAAMRDRLVLLNAAVVRHLLWTAYGSASVNNMYTAQEHMALDVFIWRGFRLPVPPGSSGASVPTVAPPSQRPPSPPPPAAPGATGRGS